eukprot:6487549-Amphidinium_carterae.1
MTLTFVRCCRPNLRLMTSPSRKGSSGARGPLIHPASTSRMVSCHTAPSMSAFPLEAHRVADNREVQRDANLS